ncbi:hypothetical protein L1887_58582 [Cichorium endivia]|nr:hypothetical protein L1887_58582 [Cichorium endivia]
MPKRARTNSKTSNNSQASSDASTIRGDEANAGSACAGVTATNDAALHLEATQDRAHDGTTQSSDLKVRSWWQTVYGESSGFSLSYVSDQSIPWSTNAFETVFKLDDSQDSKKVLRLHQERNEIVRAIVTIFKEVCPHILNEQPFIHFRHQKVHVRFHSPSFLQALWKAPPSFKGKPMKLVSKGLAKGGIRVYTACLPSESMVDLEKRLKAKTFPGRCDDQLPRRSLLRGTVPYEEAIKVEGMSPARGILTSFEMSVLPRLFRFCDLLSSVIQSTDGRAMHSQKEGRPKMKSQRAHFCAAPSLMASRCERPG